jgi:hypothetical protein
MRNNANYSATTLSSAPSAPTGHLPQIPKFGGFGEGQGGSWKIRGKSIIDIYVH